ncbi:hypothetical protein [Pontimicrobium aquaticum]|uniref:Bulb-type lectin domain-containing protein n=1 Tax=Pontimicrobium aquaticum TaxID=2565367 RepID=A0A4U0F0H9_9FLAO|nr:hypothetical protein [Pontimicrobium aquaticum]TJY37925.1 hypothetical protein E5167_01325 [Pontimicrobium aquaticum]
MKNSYLLLILFLFLFNCSTKDDTNNPTETPDEVNPNFSTMKVIDGKEFWKLIKTTDGGYIGIVHSGNYEIIKLDSNFNITWDKEYGGSESDYAESIIQTNDGGYLIIGWTTSSDGDVSNNYGDYDIWVIKTDSNGNLIWEKNYGGSKAESLRGEHLIKQTNDGGFVFVGSTESDDNDVSNSYGDHDIWFVKISSTGDIEFEKNFGGSEGDYGREVLITQGGYSLLCKVNSLDGDFNKVDNWIVNLNQLGELNWKLNLNSTNSGAINTLSNGRLVSVSTSLFDYSILTIDGDGNVVNDKTIGLNGVSTKQPFANKVLETEDKGLLIIGDLGNGNNQDAVIFRTNSDLIKIYHKVYNGNYFDKSRSVFSISSDEYIYQFITNSNDIEGVNYSSFGASVIVGLEEM